MAYQTARQARREDAASKTGRMANHQKSYAAPWVGQLVLACRKCQKKLKHDNRAGALAKLKKAAKKYNRENPEERVHLVNVQCMDLCPKGGVTVCVPARNPGRLSILSSDKQIADLYTPSRPT